MREWVTIGVAFALGIVGMLCGGLLANEIWGQPCDCSKVCAPVGERDAGIYGTGLLILGPGDSAVCNPFASPLVP